MSHTTAQYRNPTLDEAVAFLMMPTTKRYRYRCIEHWRELCGNEFARDVEAQVRAKRKNRVEVA